MAIRWNLTKTALSRVRSFQDYGWIFQFTTRRFVETRDPGTLVPGTGPLVVEKEGGATAFLATSVCPERAVEEYERRRRR